MLVAVYFVLSSYLSVNLSGIRISLDVLPILIAAALYGPVDGMIVGFIGNFLFQLAGPYGVSATTFLWALPDAARGLMAGALLGNGALRPMSFFSLLWRLALTSAVFTALTTAVMYVDCLVFQYSFAAYSPFILIRFITGVAVAAISAVILPPILKAIGKSGAKYGGAAA